MSTRTLVVLLVATNAAWAILWFNRTPEPDEPPSAPLDVAEKPAPIEGPLLHGAAPDVDPAAVDGGPSAHDVSESEIESEGEAAPTEEERAEQARQQARLEVLRGIVAKVMQVEDAAVRAEGLAEIEALIRSTDPFDVELGLSAVYHIREVEVDRTIFRDLALEHLDGATPGIRRSALYALHAADPAAAQARYALGAATDEDAIVRGHASRLLRLYGVELEGEAAKAVTALLGDEDIRVRKGTLRGLWGVSAPEEVQRKLVELASAPATEHDAIYHGLSPLEGKSRPVIDALVARLTHASRDVRGRAHWGLQRGVPEAERPYVATRYAEHLTTFLTDKSRIEALKMIARYGDASLAPDLERFASNDLVDADVQAAARKVALALEEKGR